MRFLIPSLTALLLLTSSCCYHPLRDRKIYPGPFASDSGSGVKVTYLGNTTILVSDGTTRLMVDGFLSRPEMLPTFFGKIAPNRGVIEKELKLAGVSDLDAVLVGHAHHDHALDAPMVADITHATVVGSESYRFVHLGAGGKMDANHLITLRAPRESHRFGKFTVTFVESDHVASRFCVQRVIEGNITAPVITPAPFSDFKCGRVYALHIAHPDGTIAVTTTAGAKSGQFSGLKKADVVFLGVGQISKATPKDRDFYWNESVDLLNPHTVIPTHWDAFTRPLSKGLKPMPWIVDNIKKTMKWTRQKGIGRVVRVMNQRDSFLLRRGNIQ